MDQGVTDASHRRLMALHRRRSRASLGIWALVLASALGMPDAALARSPIGGEARAALSDASARRFLVETIEEKVTGDWGKAWASLYPFHKRIVSRNTYVRCETRTAFPAPLESLRVTEVRPAAVHVPGLSRTVAGVALTDQGKLIATYALCGFANFSSIAIQIGGIGGLAPERRGDLARFGLRAVLGGSIATFMTATIAGVLTYLGS